MTAALHRRHSPFAALLRAEFLLRVRRPGTLIVALAVLAVTWLMIADPASGLTLLEANKHRLAYSSGTLAYGSAAMGSVLLGLAGFYLARGRVQEDLRSGMAGVLAASPVDNQTLLLSRALGAFAYLMALAGVLLMGTWALHALRGEGPWLPWVYVEHYLLMLVPQLLWTACCATLFDAWAPLMGRRGDVLYFFVWTALFALMPLNEHLQGLNASLLLDFSGLATSVFALAQQLGTPHIAIGGNSFDPNLPLRAFPPDLWTLPMVAWRLGALALAALPLLLALPLFHRYRPDRVRARSAAAAHGRLGRAVAWSLSPFTRGLGRLLPLVGRLPLAGVWAEGMLSLISQPLALVWLVAAWLGTSAVPPAHLGAGVAAVLAGWALWAAELGARDTQQAGTLALSTSLPGGAPRRVLTRWAAATWLGLAGCATAIAQQPALLTPLAAGLAAASAAALVLGRLSGGGRAFLALFLFWLFVAVQAPQVGALDWLGFNGVAPTAMPAFTALVAVMGLTVGLWQARRR
ncbi:hypothetical protein [Inhella gelatinilytica]|uniref:Uncharacterized protein n=1 Tax=Inhella gelatinilytica TaxID=2795030 RepID=A0A931N9L5_9BURK|nr:hypothetical protein [Inhella gelatinilytica]MBH9551493.1 hypothetical protein [Inhella gelatinilytica]